MMTAAKLNWRMREEGGSVHRLGRVRLDDRLGLGLTSIATHVLNMNSTAAAARMLASLNCCCRGGSGI
jgi:hypothetical protein